MIQRRDPEENDDQHPINDDGVSSPPRGLGRVARHGARGTMVAQVLVQIGSIMTTMLLARLLTPTEFGLIAVTQSIMGAAALANLGGVGAALVVRKGSIERASSSYFWLSAIIGAAIVASVYLLAPALTLALSQPAAAQYLRVLALGLPLSLMAAVPSVLLQRDLKYSLLNRIAIATALTYFGIEVVLALLGWGAWAVILGQVLQQAATLAAVLGSARWLPRHGLSIGAIRPDLGVIGGITASRLFDYVHKNADYWAVSRVLGGATLGTYYVAYVLPDIVRLRLSGVFRVIMLPIVSQHTDPATSRAYWGRATTVMLVLGIPVLTGIAAVADPLVLLFFGAQWSAAVVPMQIITVATIAELVVQAVGTMALAQGMIGRHTIVLGVRASLTATLAAAAAALGQSLLAVAAAVSLSAIATLVVQEFVVSKRLGIGLRLIARPLVSSTLLSALMFSCVQAFLANLPEDFPLTASLALAVIAGVTVYFGASLLLARPLLLLTMNETKRLLKGGR